MFQKQEVGGNELGNLADTLPWLQNQAGQDLWRAKRAMKIVIKRLGDGILQLTNKLKQASTFSILFKNKQGMEKTSSPPAFLPFGPLKAT